MVLCQHFSICAEMLLVIQDVLLQTPFFLLAVLLGFHRAPILIDLISNRLKQQQNQTEIAAEPKNSTSTSTSTSDPHVKSDDNTTPSNTETNGINYGIYTVPDSDEQQENADAVYIEWEDNYLSDLKYRLELWIQIFNVFIDIPFNFLLLLGLLFFNHIKTIYQ